MKKIIALFMVVTMMLSLVACGGGGSKETKSVAKDLTTLEIADGIKGKIEMKDGMNLVESERNAENAFPGITDLVSEYTIYINATGGYAEEIAVMRLKDGSSMDDLKALMDERIAYQKITFKDYQPREMPKLEDPVIETYDNLIIFVVSDNSPAAKEAIKTTLGV